MAVEQQVNRLLNTHLKEVMEVLTKEGLMTPEIEACLMSKCYKGDVVTEVSTSSSSTSSSASKAQKKSKSASKHKTEKSESKPKKPPSDRQVLIGKLINRMKDEFTEFVDKEVSIYSKNGDKKLSFHMCAMGVAQYAVTRILKSGESSEDKALLDGMMKFNQEHGVKYFTVDDETKVVSCAKEEKHERDDNGDNDDNDDEAYDVETVDEDNYEDDEDES